MFKTMMTKAHRSCRTAKTRRELEGLTDNTLRDIGIHRCDIDTVSRGGRQ